jgi:hypothetical protein
MRILNLSLVLFSIALLLMPSGVEASNTSHPAGSSKYVPVLSDAKIKQILENPTQGRRHKFSLKDSGGRSMDSLSVLQLSGQSYKYAGVYHSIVNDRTQVHLAVSNDLITWRHRGLLIDHAGMPRIGNVRGSSWIAITYEKWTPAGAGSTIPTNVAFRLFYNSNDLLNRISRSTYVMPYHGPFSRRRDQVDGTPSIYDMFIKNYGGWWTVDGQYGFHIGNFPANRLDDNGVTSINQMFNPVGGTQAFSSTAIGYNNRFKAIGATGGIGQRDTLVTTTGRFNIQEYHRGRIGTDWDKWSIALYKFGDPYNYPTGRGTMIKLSPQTPGGSRSFGNPSVAIVDRPEGGGKAMVVSYFLFSQGAAPGEGGPLIYYYHI